MLNLGAALAIGFDVALEAFRDGGDPEELMLATNTGAGFEHPLGPGARQGIAELTGRGDMLQDYDAGRCCKRRGVREPVK